jgi:putative oxidoreductase
MGKGSIPDRGDKPKEVAQGRKRKPFFADPVTLLVLRIIMGAVMITASAYKIFSPEIFAAKVAEYQLIPEVFVPLIAVVFPWLEFIAGVLLILDIYARSAALVIIVLQLGFICGMSYDLAGGVIHDCGCFDFLEEPISVLTILRDFVFVGLALPVLLYGRNVFLPKKER